MLLNAPAVTYWLDGNMRLYSGLVDNMAKKIIYNYIQWVFDSNNNAPMKFEDIFLDLISPEFYKHIFYIRNNIINILNFIENPKFQEDLIKSTAPTPPKYITETIQKAAPVVFNTQPIKEYK